MNEGEKIEGSLNMIKDNLEIARSRKLGKFQENFQNENIIIDGV
jgi:hypothetical protein